MLLPIRSKWATASDIGRVVDTLVELGGELGLEIRQVDTGGKGCWSDNDCYLREAETTGSRSVIAVEVVKTGSGRLHVTPRVIDTVARTVRVLGLVRSEPGVLRAQLRSSVAKIRDLVPQPSSTSVVPPPGPLPPIPPAPAPEPEPTPAPVPWYQTISINAFASAAYTYNFNRPPTATNALRVFDFEHGSATIDVAELVIQRAVAQPRDTGFRVDIVAGSAIPRVSAASGLFRDSAGTAGDVDLQQAFASYIAPVGRGLRFDAGKFTSPAGAEVIEGYDGFGDHYSRSFLFGFAVPFTHTGIRIGYPFSDRISATLFGINGWDVVRDNNKTKSFGAQLTLLPATDFTISATYLGGGERTDDVRPLRHLGDLVVVWKPSQRLALAANLDYAVDGGQRWYGGAGYVRLDPASGVSVAVRGETFSDPDGARTGVSQNLWETTLTMAFALARGFTFRIELRYDHSDQPVFPAASSDRRFQLTAASNAIYAL